jgi:hypothetical protein
MFSTVRITNIEPNGDKSFGTGFLFNAGTSLAPDETVAVLISNKHVLEGASALTFDLIARNADNTGPDLRKGPQPHTVTATGFIGHPDPSVDVAVMPLTNLILSMNEAERPYLNMLNWWHLPSTATLNRLDVIEDLIFIGYPDGWIDEFNGTPIVRQAITATPLNLDFDGDPTFLVDGSVFAGSRGSPVFILNRGSWTGPEGSVLGDRILLVGIIASTGMRHEDLPVHTATRPFVRVSDELDLGFAFSVEAITTTVNHALTQSGLPTFGGMA